MPPTPIQPQKPSIFPGKPRYRGFHRIYVYTTNLQSGSSPKIVRVRMLAVSICDYQSRVCFGYQGYLYELSSYRPSVFPFLLLRSPPPFPTFPASQIGVSAEILRRKTKADARPKNNHGNRKNKAIPKRRMSLGMSLVRGTDNVNVL